ncbi:Flp pilus assembly protein CpaB [Oceanomicrobium pacificus]|uniref:Flp pilus assembly protein CpaB n=1 Tax=Oceanomicrobium pacificus TaxID=2692916 RepID=A0A6B0TUS8_9RHOB|nr:Flp pilus assembly protein CpaB [Oceanomicrobium pacificus]MXU65338.1 Flp pilus assembly protein CpaB [Oceanomicrobium pacificus]
MRGIFILVLLAGLGLAGFAVYMVMQQFEDYEIRMAALQANATPAIELTTVVVAEKPLPFGKALDREDAVEIEWPAEYVPEGAFTSLDDLFGPEGTDPRAILRQMERHEPILISKVTKFGQDAGLRARLSKGMRAFTLRVDVATGVSGFIQPGDRIDIYWTGRQSDKTITKLLLEDVEIIAVDQISDQDLSRPIVARTVTVEVSPRRVAELAQAQGSGRLSLSLRGLSDSEEVGEVEVDQKDITGEIERVVVEEKRCFLTVVRAGKREQIPTPCQE